MLQQFNSFQYSDKFELFELNIAINKLQEIIQNKLEEFNKKVFNEILVKCEDSIKGLK